MTYIPNQAQTFGNFVPTTYIWDLIAQLQSTDVNSAEFKDLLVRLHQNIGVMGIVLNSRAFGEFNNFEFQNGNLWFNPNSLTQNDPRPGFRVAVNFGALPAAGSKQVAHGLDIVVPTEYQMYHFYGAAINQTTGAFVSLPHLDVTVAANNLQLNGDATYVTITTGGTDYSAYIGLIVIEFLKF